MINPAVANAITSGLIALYAVTESRPGPAGRVILAGAAVGSFLIALSEWKRNPGLTTVDGIYTVRGVSRSPLLPSSRHGQAPRSQGRFLLPAPE